MKIGSEDAHKIGVRRALDTNNDPDLPIATVSGLLSGCE
jgi:hypothetical protein